MGTHEELGRVFPAWADEQTRRGLLASFSRPRDVNPEAHDQRVAFWRGALAWALASGRAGPSVFVLPAASELARVFALPDGARPLGLGHVAAVLLARGELRRPAGGTRADSVAGLAARVARMALSVPLAALRWALSDGETQEHEADEADVPLIHARAVEECARLAAEAIPHRAMAYAEFIDAINDARKRKELAPVASNADADLLIEHMEAGGLLAVSRSDSASNVAMSSVSFWASVLWGTRGEARKDTEPAESRESWVVRVGSAQPITAEEAGAVHTRLLCGRLEARVAELGAEASRRRAAAASALRAGDRALAISLVRHARAADDARARRMASLETLAGVLAAVDAAHTNAEVARALEAGRAALQAAMAGTSAARVRDTVAGVEALLGEHADVAAALASPVCDAGAEDLEAELDAIACGASTLGETGPGSVAAGDATPAVLNPDAVRAALDALPEIPTHDPREALALVLPPVSPAGGADAGSGEQRVSVAETA